jgi:hypothetical protein
MVVKLTMTMSEVSILRTILLDEIARVEGLSERQRTEDDVKSLSAASKVLRQLELYRSNPR